jgi:hypothetical protein
MSHSVGQQSRDYNYRDVHMISEVTKVQLALSALWNTSENMKIHSYLAGAIP